MDFFQSSIVLEPMRFSLLVEKDWLASADLGGGVDVVLVIVSSGCFGVTHYAKQVVIFSFRLNHMLSNFCALASTRVSCVVAAFRLDEKIDATAEVLVGKVVAALLVVYSSKSVVQEGGLVAEIGKRLLWIRLAFTVDVIVDYSRRRDDGYV